MMVFVVTVITGIYVWCIIYGITAELPPLEPEPAIDRWRRSCREQGLVLNMPAYHDGFEAYVPSKFKNAPFLLDRWERFTSSSPSGPLNAPPTAS